jgi:dTDP-glucose pyrophosphorylase
MSWKNLKVSPKCSLYYALEVIEKEGCGAVVVCSEDNKLVGLITDGDVRRAILSKKSLDSPVSDIMTRNPKYVFEGTTKEEIKNILSFNKISHLPVINNHSEIVGFETVKTIEQIEPHKNTVFLMAGGFGTRLKPLTNDVPKPMLRVGGKPILEHIILEFKKNGFFNFVISLHYHPKQIRDYFGQGNNLGVNIDYVYENMPLGTAGALRLLPSKYRQAPIIVMNGDLLTKVNSDKLLKFHCKRYDSEATMAVREFDYQVPYGVVETKDDSFLGVAEKPLQKFMVNAGIYVINPECIEKIPHNTRYDMTDLINSIPNVSVFLIHEYWLDIGKMPDFERAQKDYIEVF